MKTKISISVITSLILLSINFWSAQALQISWSNLTIVNTSNELKITRWNIFNFFADYYSWQIPESYKYIKVNYLDIDSWTELEESLQKLIYLDLIENPLKSFEKNNELSAWAFYRLSEKILWIKVEDIETEEALQNRNTDNNDIQIMTNFLWEQTIEIETKSTNSEVKQKIAILKDIYDTIISKHYNKDNFDEWEILDSAINWITDWVDDKYTVYFPPVESESFHDSLSWDYEWIWSYVDMEKPGFVRIVSPIPWSPSEKAGLKWGDLVIKVDWKEIGENNSLREVITWIKWPAWSTVILTVDREWKIFDIEVTRERIIITDIEAEVLNTTTYYIHIKSFWEHVAKDFKETITEISNDKNINKVIIDLRNNWWGYLTEVAEMLSYFVEKWETTAVVKYHDSEKTFTSRWYDLVDFSKYDLVILQNSWTASASEILIWTLRDYYPDLDLIWEKTYWKWSVQIMKNYRDGSLLKYTIAKWFTWLTETWIDQIWIEPTIKVIFDLDNYRKNWFDNQLDKAKFID